MISIIFILSVLWLGFVLDEEFAISRGDFLVRLASAIILGCFWSAWLVYLLAWCSSGLRLWTVIDATVVILLFNSYAWRRRRRNLAWFSSLLSFDRRFWGAYFIFPVLVTAVFAFGFWTDPDGNILYQGNFTDLAFHMGTVSAFLEQTAFPPLNPQFAAAKLSYHFMADFFSSILCRGGFSLFYGLKVPMVLFAFSLSSLTCHLFQSVLKQRIAAVCACIFFFFGHIGVFNLVYGLAGYPIGNVPLSLKSWASVEDHLTYPYFNFLNVLVDFFQPQLAFLFGFPCAVLVLLVLFRKYSQREPFDKTAYFIVALVALLPLFHMHSFLVLAPLVALWLFSERWGAATSAPGGNPAVPGGRFYGRASVRILAAAIAGAAVALQLAFVLSQKKITGFSGFDVSTKLGALPEIPDFLHARRLWFWVRAAGAPFILGLVGFFLPPSFQCRSKDPGRRANIALLALFAVTSGYFLVINFYRFTPSWGDNNKFFLYWDVMLCLYAGRLLSRLWAASRSLRAMACVFLLLGAIVPSAVELSLRWRRGPSTLFTGCDQMTADWIRQNTPKDAVFLTVNSYTNYVSALAGRRVVNGSYTRETGFADDAIEASVARAFREANPALIDTVKVTHVVVGPEEKNRYYVNRTIMGRWHKLLFDRTCGGLEYSVYEVRDIPPEELEAERRKGEIRGFLWLSEQEPSFAKQYGNLQYDESFDLTPLRLNGKVYSTGLGTHAPSEIRFDLDGKYSTFESDVGVDDLQRGTPGSVIFRVVVDEKNAFSSHVLVGGSPHETVRIDLTGAKTLTLIVEDAGDGNHNDHADWADAKLTLKR